MEVACLNCEVLLNRSPSHIKRKVFCNRECRKAFSRSDIKCPGCDSIFKRDPKQPSTKYCSWECFKNSRWQIVECNTCQKPFRKRISEIKKALNNHHLHMCSRACRNTYTSKLLGGDGNWQVGGKYKTYGKRKSWRKVRKAALERDDHTCQQCGTKSNLEVHHWEPYQLTQNNDLDNLVTLCRECHQEKHKEYVREGFYEDFYREIGQ